jgi:hypothetical protein
MNATDSIIDLPEDLGISDGMTLAKKAYLAARYMASHNITSVYKMEELAGISYRQISAARFILRIGTEEEKQRLADGKTNVYSMIKKMHARRRTNGEPVRTVRKAGDALQPSLQLSSKIKSRDQPGPAVKVPQDYASLSAWCRAGLELEIAGNAEEAARAIGMSKHTYRSVRDIIMLADRDDLRPDDAAAVARALKILDETCYVSKAYHLVKPIVQRLWPSRSRRAVDDERRVEPFKNAIIAIAATCERGAGLDVPYLSEKHVEEFTDQLRQAGRHIKQLTDKIRSVRC